MLTTLSNNVIRFTVAGMPVNPTAVPLVVAAEVPIVIPETVDQVGAAPDPAEVNTWPDVPAAPVKVNAVVMLADARVGLVNVLFVNVSEPAKVANVPVVGNVTLVAALAVRVNEYAPDVARVAPSAMVSVAAVAGAVSATLLMLVADATPKIGVTNVGLVARTLLPVPVFVTLTRFLDASVATALDAVSAENIALALNVAVPPTNKPLVIPTPPAVKIEPVEPLVESVARVELMPWANGIRAVVAVCPSFVIAVDKPLAKSAVSALNAELLMTVPVTTGWPEVLIWNVPEPL